MAAYGGRQVRRLDQRTPAVSRAGSGPAPQGGVVIAREIIVIGGKGGVFVYNASGQLIDSIAALANVDPITHSNKQGIVNYDPTHSLYAQLNGAQLAFVDTALGGNAVLNLAQLGGSGSASEGFQGSSFFYVWGGIAGGGNVTMLFPTGVAATDTLNLGEIFAAGGTPWLMPGTFNFNCGDAILTALGAGQYILASGDLNTIINAHGSGDLFRWVHTGSISDGTTTGGGFIGGATIDGAACSGAAVGIHAGDINALRFDCRCQNFNQTGGSWGFLFDNQNFFTERMQINIRARSCGFAGGDGGSVGFNVGGATTSTGSFARLKGRIEITTATNQRDGLVLTNGAHIYDCDLEVMGNFSGGASATTAAALRITGTVPVGHPGAGTASAITNGRFEVGLECGTGAQTPTTFIQGTSSNGVRDCYGNVNWNNNFTSSGITGPGWRYDGQVQGDTSLGTRRSYGTAATQTITANGQTISTEVTSAKIPIANAGAFTGLILAPGVEDGQLIYLINTGTGAQQFAVAGTSNVAAGVGANLSVGRMLPLIWDAGTALWYSI